MPAYVIDASVAVQHLIADQFTSNRDESYS